MVGGRDFFSRTDPVAKLNLATGGATGRQAGSTFKPFALVAALEPGHLADRGVRRSGRTSTSRCPPGSRPASGPSTITRSAAVGGAVTLEQATINSVNTVYAQLIMQVGPPSVVRRRPSDGHHHARCTPYPRPSWGRTRSNTLEMASAYGTLATIGRHAPPIAVSKITDAAGRLI